MDEARGERGDSAGTRCGFGARDDESRHNRGRDNDFRSHYDGDSNHDEGRFSYDGCSNQAG